MFGEDSKLRKKLFGAENAKCMNIELGYYGVGFLGETKNEVDTLRSTIDEQRIRINMLAGLLMQAIPANVLRKKLKEGCGITDNDVENNHTVQSFLEKKIDP